MDDDHFVSEGRWPTEPDPEKEWVYTTPGGAQAEREGRAAHPWEVFRDAVISRQVRDQLNLVERLAVAAIEADLLPDCWAEEKTDALQALREVMERWDSNPTTGIFAPEWSALPDGSWPS